LVRERTVIQICRPSRVGGEAGSEPGSEEMQQAAHTTLLLLPGRRGRRGRGRRDGATTPAGTTVCRGR
jgi:hypothetical protein